MAQSAPRSMQVRRSSARDAAWVAPCRSPSAGQATMEGTSAPGPAPREVALHHHADAGGGQLALHAVNEPAVHGRALCQVREDRSHALGPVERELDGGSASS